jgi:hypothetical protein
LTFLGNFGKDYQGMSIRFAAVITNNSYFVRPQLNKMRFTAEQDLLQQSVCTQSQAAAIKYLILGVSVVLNC